MSLYVMSDLHLSSDGSKSMEVFGQRWTDYIEKIEKNWRAVVTDEDTVIVPGDISWSLRLEDSLADFQFLESLPGKKLIGKGNHDFWWSTHSKLKTFWEKHNIHSVDILYNNAHRFEDCIVSGTRGWFLEEGQQKTIGEVEYSKIVNREAIRLRLSLEEAKKLRDESGEVLPILVFLHFPPVWGEFVCREIVDVLHEFGVRTCYFGHIHGAYYAPRTTTFEDIDFIFSSADYLNFTPLPVFVG